MPLPTINTSIIARQSSKEIVYFHLKQWIVDGVLVPGEKINDSEIASLFSVSRTPVREAILNLESQQLVEIIPGRGTTVSHFDMESIKVLYEAIISIHLSVLTIAFPKIDNNTINLLKKINKRFLACANSGDLALTRSTDNEFHQVFFELADNSYLNSFYEQLSIHTTRIENVFFRLEKKIEDSYTTHKNLIQYLVAKDLENAKQALASNCSNTLNNIEDINHNGEVLKS